MYLQTMPARQVQESEKLEYQGYVDLLEIGGNNALILDDSEDLNTAVNLAISLAFICVAQHCACSRRILVKNSTAGDSFIKQLVLVAGELHISRWDSDLLGCALENTRGSAALTER